MKKVFLFLLTALLAAPAGGCEEPLRPDGYAIGVVDSVFVGGDEAVYTLDVTDANPLLHGQVRFVTPIANGGETVKTWPDFEVATVGMDVDMSVAITYYNVNGKKFIAKRFIVWNDALRTGTKDEQEESVRVMNGLLLRTEPSSWNAVLVDPGNRPEILRVRQDGRLSSGETWLRWPVVKQGLPRKTVAEFRAHWNK